MTWIENIMIIIGISSEIFAIVECKGSMLAYIKKSHVFVIGAIFSVLQLLALNVGYFVLNLIMAKSNEAEGILLGHILAITIFCTLGIRLIRKAIKNESINEKREDGIDIKKYIISLLVMNFYTIAIGAASRVCDTNLLSICICLVIATFGAVFAGIYTGYHIGYKQKTKAYACGGILLIIGALDMAVRYFVL